jgi:EAL domain-containing protein (putative c-di-GMP-specific phosphodiesterase class I)
MRPMILAAGRGKGSRATTIGRQARVDSGLDGLSGLLGLPLGDVGLLGAIEAVRDRALRDHMTAISLAAALPIAPPAVPVSLGLASEQVWTVYQPIVDNDVAVGFEALLRVDHPAHPTTPALFQHFTTTGLVAELDSFAARLAVFGAARWLGERRLFVNMGVKPIAQMQAFVHALRDDIDGELRFDQLVLEINACQAVDTANDLAQVLTEARLLGMQVALDDVSGGARLRELAHVLRPEWLKIAGSVTERVGQVEGAREITAALHLAQQIGATVIAENVETQQQYEALHGLGVHHLRGFFIDRMLNVDWDTRLPISSIAPDSLA